MTEMKKYFIDNCISFAAFARKHGLEKSTLSRVVNGEINCERRGGNTERVARVLWEQGIWVGEKPKVLQKADKETKN